MKRRALTLGTALAVSAATATVVTTPARAMVPAPAAAPARTSAPAPLTGKAVYLSDKNGIQVLTYNGRWTSQTVGGASFAGQFSVAPDGRRIAWIDGKNRLHVLSPAGDKVVARNAAYIGPCLTPAWSADGRRIAFPLKGQSETRFVNAVDADGKNLTRIGKTLGPCHLTWSADGRTLAGYAGTTDGVHLLDTRLHVSRRAPGIKLANHVESVSPDARRIVVNTIGRNAPGGDGSWPTSFTPSIYDTVTGKKIPIPVGGKLLGARYLRDGRLVVRVAGRTANTLVVLNASGREIQRLAEPARARTFGLLGILG
ncbi:hypothetical protein [Streptosporangium lutulentum]|uniref:WD40-like Beta Propeller Repeat n=1 Tax=Streptosporangium lutulentum TaxID=1461250 RepID=A0ABT9QEX4_9ACTN|nr:hypothetical protein [Streptosporangium lutulentum]MDP9845321.1 hypothetical protein [Streptosporangium lutulentum]